MKNERLERLIDLSRQVPEVKIMIRVICDKEGATGAGHLCDLNPEAFDELYEAATSMVDQLGTE